MSVMKILPLVSRWSFSVAFFAIAFPVCGDPLDHWTSFPSGTTNHLRSVAFGSGVFVASGDLGTMLTSSNGTVWTPVATGVTNALLGVTFGHGRFVAVGQAGAILTSSNGAAWSAQGAGIHNALNAVAFTELGFVAVGDLGTIVTSSNGFNWVSQTSGTSAMLVGVGGGFGTTFAGAAVNPPALFWSTNGSAWSYMTNVPKYAQPDLFNAGFAYGNGVLLGVRIRGEFCRSTDGVNWTHQYSPFEYCFGLAYARNQFVVVGGNFSRGGRTIGTSTNGLSWQPRYFRSTEDRLLGIAYGNYRFVAVGDNGSILASDPMLWLSNPSVVSNGLQMTLHGNSGGAYHVQATTSVTAGSWQEIGVVTNVGETVEFAIPFPPNSPRACYRVRGD